MHTGASASIHNKSRASTERALPFAPGALVAGSGAVGAAMANLWAHHGVDVMFVDNAAEICLAPRAIALDNEALRTLGTCDEERRLQAKSTIGFAIVTGRPVTSCDGSIACLPLRGKPLHTTALARASAIRSA
ncbi:hypothetical protein DIE07_04815 [Burkholderia sp. Bp9002]|nr:hypothetical protein DIE18_05545 [Burkholderia sp. Bp9125]RQS14774.1 hypothetical protein DIE07_04815 [Burkholderia sp. Bp9002]